MIVGGEERSSRAAAKVQIRRDSTDHSVHSEKVTEERVKVRKTRENKTR